MEAKIQFLLFILASIIFGSNSQVLTSWSSPLSAVSMHPTFIVSLRQGNQVHGSVVVPNQEGYIVYFYRPNEYYPNNAAFQYIQFTGSANFTSLPLDTTGFWRVEVLPGNSNQNYLILVSIANSQNSADYYVDVARDKMLFVTYFQEGENCSFNVQGIANGMERDITIEMYAGNQNLDFVKRDTIFVNTNPANNQYDVNCMAQTTGYYYIYVSATVTIMPLFPRVLVSYQSDNYPCPANPMYKDASHVFATCIQLALNSGYPCLTFDYNLNRCTKCAAGYIVQTGICYLSVECGLDRYFHLGSCYNVIENCIAFQSVGGYCSKCSNGFLLVNNNQGQFCQMAPTMTATTTITTPINSNIIQTSPQNISNVQNGSTSSLNSNQVGTNPQDTTTTYPKTNIALHKVPITCPQGTYLLNGLCAIIPPNCQEFNQNLRMCINCNSMYTLNLTSYGCDQAQVACPMGYTNVGDNCIIYPANCVATNSWGNCTNCMINFSLDKNNNKCVPKQCGNRQYLSNGSCISVSQYCSAFDPYNGNCLSCLNNYLLAANGTCNTPQYYNQLASNGCGSRQYRLGNICYLVDKKCNAYDQYTGYCLSCIDLTQLLDKSTGKCISIGDICQNRYYLDPTTHTCLEVNPFCNTYDPATGYCLSCTYGLTLFRGGCINVTPCALNQYRNQDGICTNADPNCDGINQTTGGCLACKAGYQINTGGICCFAQNYLLTSTCKAFLAENCKSQRPIFLNCLQCSPGYSLVNGVFGKCVSIK